MEIKFAIKIKLVSIIIFIVPIYVGVSQTEDSMHLSYNLYGKQCNTTKSYNINNEVHFYVNDEHFKAIPEKNDVLEISSGNLKKIKIIDISEFLDLANKKRKKLIEEGKKNKLIEILMNDQVFDKIYLYMKGRGNSIKRYTVTWVEQSK